MDEEVTKTGVGLTIKEFILAINEKDFDKMHATTPTVYGWIDNPPLLPDIIQVIE